MANTLAFATRDATPVSPGHTLVIPHRHCTNFFDLTHEEMAACFTLICEIRSQMDRGPEPPDAYNVGVNAGVVAGQSIPHVHLHVIPRYRGDVPDPRGGVRNVIPCPHPGHGSR